MPPKPEEYLFGGKYLPPDLNTLQKLEALIDRNFRQTKSQKDYARQLDLSTYQLNRISKRYRQQTIYELWQTRFYTEAENLLKYTQLSVKEIAFELNCCDPAHFNNGFKKRTGLSPLKFRKYIKE